MNNEFLLDKDLDPTAKCILAVILTNKDDWVVYPEEIAKRMGIHRNTVDKYIKKLAELGYARITKKSLGRSRGMETCREFSDRKIFISQNL